MGTSTVYNVEVQFGAIDRGAERTMGVIADRAQRAEKSIGGMQKKMEETTTGGMPGAMPGSSPGAAPGALPPRSSEPAGGPRLPPWMQRLPENERQRFAEERQEMLLRRARMRGVKLEMAGERAGHQLMAASMMALGGEAKTLGQKLEKLGGVSFGVGATLVSMGGNAGAVGSSMLKLAGPVSMFGAVLEVGTEVFHSFTEAMAEQEKTVWQIAAEAKKVGIKEEILASMGARTKAQVALQEEEYAHTLGYANAAVMQAAQASLDHARAEHRNITLAATAVEELGAMPKKTSPAFMAWRQKVEDAARSMGTMSDTAEVFNGRVEELIRQSEMSLATQSARMKEDLRVQGVERDFGDSQLMMRFTPKDIADRDRMVAEYQREWQHYAEKRGLDSEEISATWKSISAKYGEVGTIEDRLVSINKEAVAEESITRRMQDMDDSLGKLDWSAKGMEASLLLARKKVLSMAVSAEQMPELYKRFVNQKIEEAHNKLPPPNLNVTIQNVEIASDDPDRFVFRSIEAAEQLLKAPVTADRAIRGGH